MKFPYEIARRHVRSGIEFQFVLRRHQQFDVSAADIDDENVAFHRTALAGKNYSPIPIDRPSRLKTLPRSALSEAPGGQHSTISSSTKRKRVKRPNFRSRRRLRAICAMEREPLNCEANCASATVSRSFWMRSKPSRV